MSQRAVINERVQSVRARIRELRGAETVKLMAVTKYRTREQALWAIQAGCDVIGENRIQEAMQKWQLERPSVPLHVIGHVQTNKVKYGIGLFNSIDSVDSERLLELIDQKSSAIQSVMIEVNIAGEATKFGLTPLAVRPFLANMECYGKLRVSGLMTILPARRENSVEESRRVRFYMQEMVDLWRMCRSEEFPWAPLEDLSMGMSGDWELAVEAGATIIRLGTYLFGARPIE